MAVSITIQGMEEINSQLNVFEQDVAEMGRLAIKQSMAQVEAAAKSNARSMLTMNYSNDKLINLISSTAVIGKDGQPAGSVGVFTNMPGVDIANQYKPSPLVAFWLQGGVQKHSLSNKSRATQRETFRSRARDSKGQDREPMHPGISPKPFLDNAWSSNAANITDIIIEQLNKVG
jgi:hypothetical protein